MRILQIASLVEPLTESPPGGAELSVQILSAAQRAAGHQVSLLALAGSAALAGVELIDLGIKRGELTPIETGRLAARNDARLFERSAQQATSERAVYARIAEYLQTNKFDIVHNHGFDYDAIFFLPDAVPVQKFFHTLHLPPMLPWITDQFKLLPKQSFESRYCTVSDSMAAEYKAAIGHLLPVVYNGIPLDALLNRPLMPIKHTAPFLWAGRISPEKGLHTAIRLVVEQLQQPLTILGRVYDEAYFEQQIRPLLNHPLLDFRGFCSRADVLSAMATSRAFVAPIEWDEPFGFVFVEALASGCPVITYHRGAAPEIVNHGITGYLAHSELELLQALKNVGRFDREACRESVRNRFTDRAMGAAYENLYLGLR